MAGPFTNCNKSKAGIAGVRVTNANALPANFTISDALTGANDWIPLDKLVKKFLLCKHLLLF